MTGEEDGGERGQERDRERDRRQHLVAAAPAEPEHAARRELGEGEDRPLGTLARAVVAAVAEVEEPRVLAARHVLAPR